MNDENMGNKSLRYCDIPLPADRYIPGFNDRPTHSPADSYSDDIPGGLRKSIIFCYGVDLFNHGYYWEAHEAWEHIWIPRRETKEGTFLKGLIQLTASVLKRLQRNFKGELKLRESSLHYLDVSGMVEDLFLTDIRSKKFLRMNCCSC